MYVKIALVLAACVAVSIGEDCLESDTTTCGHVLCSDGYSPICDKNVCTCGPAPDLTACVTLADCDAYWGSNHCRHRDRHCIDGHCICIRL